LGGGYDGGAGDVGGDWVELVGLMAEVVVVILVVVVVVLLMVIGWW